jgi:Concanavalin A-like lectin/glucanases superfamily
MNIRVFSALCAFSSFLFIGCVANTGNTDPQNTEQSPVEQPTPGIPENPGNPPVPPQNPPPSQPDPADNFVSLSGAGEFLSHTGNLVEGEAAHTVEFFVKFAQIPTTDVGQSLYSFRDSLGTVSGLVQGYFANSPTLRAIMNTGGNGIAVSLEVDRWYHIAVVFTNNNGSYRFATYLNGVRQASGGGSSAFLSYSDFFEIGRPFNVISGKTASLNGSIDGVRVSRGARYTTGSFTIPPRKTMAADANTVAVWNFNETAGDGKYYDAVSQKLIERKQFVIQ